MGPGERLSRAGYLLYPRRVLLRRAVVTYSRDRSGSHLHSARQPVPSVHSVARISDPVALAGHNNNRRRRRRRRTHDVLGPFHCT